MYLIVINLIPTVTYFLVIYVLGYCESSGCPAPELIKPCVCEDNGIICGGHSDIDLVNIFQTLEK